MTGRLLIDGTDAYTAYGVWVGYNTIGKMVEFPQFKEMPSTDWPERDGIDYDLSSVVIKERQFSLNMFIHDWFDVAQFENALSDGLYHTFVFGRMQRSFTLRFVSITNVQRKGTLGTFTLTLSDDNPAVPSAMPQGYPLYNYRATGYEFDNIDFGELGIVITRGTAASMIAPASPKDNVKFSDSAYIAGVTYDNAKPWHKERTVTLCMNIHTDTISDFWARHDALAYKLLTNGWHKLTCNDGISCDCVYRSNAVSRFLTTDTYGTPNGVWCDMTVTFTIRHTEVLDVGEFLTDDNGNYVTYNNQRIQV